MSLDVFKKDLVFRSGGGHLLVTSVPQIIAALLPRNSLHLISLLKVPTLTSLGYTESQECQIQETVPERRHKIMCCSRPRTGAKRLKRVEVPLLKEKKHLLLQSSLWKGLATDCISCK